MSLLLLLLTDSQEKIEKVMNVFKNNPEVLLVQHEFDEINANNQKLKNEEIY